ncbi:class I SAM-dependent methyltransferase [Shouchella hunanensis]|uniref:Class I SAM-dependent methyltransferase n=1 Tax=Shouchella hunanensis TaxID=766894 RepID=A0ABY7VZK5_9BACI|nr:class I SAM-dependent methyltransferase [Shouchella hunanensis]WDF02150.1 class I SAM-dependent methyltransferase [Shouchella hunanensis]GAF23607.1 2-heptaprenyl-1,4-naphthoquinone methyltransferase [Bacillus sp. JCM 19047]
MNDRIQRKIANLEGLQRFPAEELLSYFPISKKDTILDLGTGTGYVARAMADKVEKVYALDSDKDILAYLMKTSEESGIRNIEPVVGDFKSLPIPKDHIDTVIASISLHEVKPLSIVLNQIRTTLKKGGVFVCIDIEKTDNPSGPRVSSEEMEWEMVNAGFTIVSKSFPAMKLGKEPLYVIVGRK